MKTRTPNAPAWTCEAGRTLTYKGEPVAMVDRIAGQQPADTDDLARAIAQALNAQHVRYGHSALARPR